MKIKVNMKHFDAPVIYYCKGYTVTAEPNSNGDLVIYRMHENMLAPQIIASLASGEWLSHEVIWGDE